jgi:hypothetical protein
MIMVKYQPPHETQKKGKPVRLAFPEEKLTLERRQLKPHIESPSDDGWKFEKIDEDPFYERMVDGKLIGWFVGYNPTKLSEFKEKGRIFPIYSTNDELIKNGYGNDDAVRQYKIRMSLKEHIRKIIRKCLFY